jgi:F-type H+-transporting ATPase subunit c
MKTLNLMVLAVVAVFVLAAPALAYTGGSNNGGPDSAILSGAAVGAGLGAALTIIGAGYGFGRIGSAALESMARQPEAAGAIQIAMIIIAALLEGATFFGLIVCFQLGGKAVW